MIANGVAVHQIRFVGEDLPEEAKKQIGARFPTAFASNITSVR
jgi:hypothetical protein